MTKLGGRIGSSIHFWPYVIAVSLLIIGVFAAMFIRFGQYTQEDVVSYRAMMAEAVGKDHTDRAVTSQHFRQNLQKDIIITRENGQFQFRLKSKDARLALERIHGETDIVENLEEVACWLQEDLMYRFADGSVVSSQDPYWKSIVPVAVAVGAVPKQRMVYLEANKATYDYEGGKFVADDARIWRYIAPGHYFTEIVDKEKAIISGVAEHVVVTFGAQGLAFKADGFQAAITLHGDARW